jgi:hypothetical protein
MRAVDSEQRTRRWEVSARAPTALTAAALVLMAALIPALADAASHHYCGPPNLVYPNIPCWSGDAHTYNYNQARYAGTGALRFCEQLVARNVEYFYSFNCRTYAGTVKGYAGDSGDIINPNTSTIIKDRVANEGRGPHTLYGYSTW